MRKYLGTIAVLLIAGLFLGVPGSLSQTYQKGYIGRQDMNNWDGSATQAFSRKTSAGGTVTLFRVGNEVDPLAIFGSSVADENDTTIARALATVQSSNAVMVLAPGNWAIGNNLTIPANVQLRIPLGTILTIASGKTLTIAGSVDAGNYRIFYGSGTAAVTGMPQIQTWWGNAERFDFSGIQANRLTFGSVVYLTASYQTLNAAVTAIGSTPTALIVTDAQTLTANVTIPTTMCLIVVKGGSIVKDSTYTVTINGSLQAGPYTVFSGFSTGDVTFGPGSVDFVRPEWWGAVADGSTASATAIQCALDAANYGVVQLSPGIYKIGSTLNINNRLTLRGVGMGNPATAGMRYGSMLQKSADALAIQIKSGSSGTVLQHFTVYSAVAGDSTAGIRVGETDTTNGAGNCVLENIWVQGMGDVGILINNGNAGIIRGCISNSNGSHGIQLYNTQMSSLNVNDWTLEGNATDSNTGNGLDISLATTTNVFGHNTAGNSGRGFYINRAYNNISGGYAESNGPNDVTGYQVEVAASGYQCHLLIYAYKKSSQLATALISAPGVWYEDISAAGKNPTVSLTGMFTANRLQAGRGSTALVNTDFALSAGWGTGSSVAVTTYSYDARWEITITTGTGTGANPTVTLTFKDEAWTFAPFMVVQYNGGTNTAIPTAITHTRGPTSVVITFVGTPDASKTVKIIGLIMG